MIKYFDKNTKGRDFFVGDIHGEVSKLKQKMQEVGFNTEVDRIFSVGDLVDRGEDSVAGANLVKLPYFFAVQGNHENMSIRYPLGNMDSDLYRRNGGGWMIDLDKGKSQEISDILRDLPYMIEVETEHGRVGVVHAEVAGDNWNSCQMKLNLKPTREMVMWGRDKITYKDNTEISGIDFVVVGHTPLTKPAKLGNVFYIDTGAVFGRELTFKTIEELIKEIK